MLLMKREINGGFNFSLACWTAGREGAISAEHEDADRLDRAGMCVHEQTKSLHRGAFFGGRGRVQAQIGTELLLKAVTWFRKEFFLYKSEFLVFIEFLHSSQAKTLISLLAPPKKRCFLLE